MTMPLPRKAIWATMLAPLSFSARMVAICSSSGSSLAIDCSAAKVTGRPVSRLSWPIQPNSFHSRIMSLAISNTPWPTRPIARPIAISSSAVAVVPGTTSPSTERWRTVREVEKAERAGADPVLDDGGHLLDVFGRWDRARPLAVAEHVGAHRTVGHVGAHVDRAGHRLERIEVFGEALPRPLHAFGERGAGDVLDAFHQPDQPLPAVGRGWREADPAVAHHHGGDPVPRGGRHLRIPGRLAVVMRVDVDPARGDDFARGVDLVRALAMNLPDGGDQPVLDRDVSSEARGAGAVDDRAVPDDEVVSGHGRILS
jgi:hypothetical protein